MRIKMLITQTGSVDGYRIDTYQLGVEYDMGKSDKHIDLANVFINQRWAEVASDKLQVVSEPTQEISNPVQKTDPNVKVSRKN